MEHLSKEHLQVLLTRLAKLMYDITEDQFRDAHGVRSSSPERLERRFAEAANIFHELNGD